MEISTLTYQFFVDFVKRVAGVILGRHKGKVCLNCGKPILENRSYCSLECYRGSFQIVKHISDAGRKANENRRGKTIEEIYGEEKANYLRETQYKRGRERLNDKSWEEVYGEEKAKEMKKKVKETRNNKLCESLPEDLLQRAKKTENYIRTEETIKKLKLSFGVHDNKVEELYNVLRGRGEKVLNVSSHKRDFTPDIIYFKDGKLIGIELEHILPTDTIFKRARKMQRKEENHKKVGFFDEIKVLFFFDETDKELLLKQLEES